MPMSMTAAAALSPWRYNQQERKQTTHLAFKEDLARKPICQVGARSAAIDRRLQRIPTAVQRQAKAHNVHQQNAQDCRAA